MIRPAGRQDLDALVALEDAFPGDRIPRSAFLRFLVMPRVDVLVVEEDGRVLGDAVVRYGASGSARLYSIVIGVEARGRGFGGALLAAVEEAAWVRGCTRVRLEVREDNAAAIALYLSRGYRVRGRSAGYYQDGMAALRMTKGLPGESSVVGGRRLGV